MANLTASGFDEVFNELRRLGDEGANVAEEMVRAGADAVKEAWKATADKHGFRASGDMINSIASSATEKSAGMIYADIYPQGKDSKKVRNAEKAFLLHYGTNKIPASYWVDEADDAAEGPMADAMMDVWDQFIDSKS